MSAQLASPAFITRRATPISDRTAPLADLSSIRRAKASPAARYVIDQVTRGQMGKNLVQGFKLKTGITVDATPRGFQLDYLGFATRPCATKAGAIMVWAHLVDKDAEAANEFRAFPTGFEASAGRIQAPI